MGFLKNFILLTIMAGFLCTSLMSCNPMGSSNSAPAGFGSESTSEENQETDSTPPSVTAPDVSAADATPKKAPTTTWVAATDTGGISHYEISIGTTSGGTDILSWKNIGNVTSYRVQNGVDSVTLGLTLGTNYYTNLRAVDSAGNTSSVASSVAWKPFSPSDVTNLLLWLDGTKTSSLFSNSGCSTAISTNGDSVRCWQDQSGNNNHFTTTGGASQLNTTGINNTQTVYMPLYRRLNATTTTTINPGSIFIVAKLSDTGNKTTFMGDATSAIRLEQNVNTGKVGAKRFQQTFPEALH